jgi:LuxR family transcriptional regulator, maltose regulon positive regulatory protein
MDEQSVSEAQIQRLNQILATKLHIPSSCHSLVPRPRLLALLNKGMERKLTLLSAPAGFGKTTLLCEWLHSPTARNIPVAWVSLDEGDNDPVRFGTYVCAALERLQAGVGERTLALLQFPQTPSTETTMTTLINEVTAIPKHFVLVLEDYHVITSPSIQQALTFLIDHLPAQMHLILASRIDPPIPLSRLRARQQMVEIRAADLRFTPQEASDFLREVMELELSAEEIATLEARTEGWIAGLQLAALSLQGRNSAGIAEFLSAFAGSHRFVLDYLAEEVLLHQLERTQTFLLQTSILDRLSGLLCDGEPVEALHQRASIWYERNHFMYQAIDHALAAQDFERAARLVEQFRASASERGELVTLLRWFAALPDAIIRRRPRLSLYYAQVLLLSGQFEAINERLQDAEQSLVRHEVEIHAEERAILEGEILTIRAVFAYLHADVAHVRKLAEEALRLLSPDHLLRGMVLLSLGSGYWLDGDLSSASRVLTEARQVSQKTGNLYIVYVTMAYLAQVRLAQGRLREAIQLYREALQLVAERGGEREGGNGLYVGLGALLYECNELEEARRLLQHGIDLAQKEENALVIIGGKITLARVLQAQGKEDEAGDLMQQSLLLAQQHNITWTWVTGPVFASQERLWLAQGNLVAAAQWANESKRTPPEHDTTQPHPPYLREVEEILLARLSLTQHKYAEALEVLDRLHTEAEAAGRMEHVLEILLLKALTYQAQGDLAHGLSAVTQVLELAKPEGYIRTFVDEGPMMAALLRKRRAAQSQETDYLDRLLEAFKHGEEHIEPASPHDRQRKVPQPLIVPLSEREREVLHLMAAAASNQEIARKLVIAVNTVKRHARNIFDKLDVDNRTQAVARARALGLL